jgi:hypothetical protein
MKLSEQPLTVKNVVQFGLYVAYRCRPWTLACQPTHDCRNGGLRGHMIIWGGLFAHGDGSTGLIKVVFCYALPTVVQGFGANETLHWFSKWGTTRGASTLSRCFWPVRLPSRTYKSNLQSKEKQPQTVTPSPPKAVVPKMLLSNPPFRQSCVGWEANVHGRQR